MFIMLASVGNREEDSYDARDTAINDLDSRLVFCVRTCTPEHGACPSGVRRQPGRTPRFLLGVPSTWRMRSQEVEREAIFSRARRDQVDVHRTSW
jgi:hypothetical protein